MYLPIEEMPAQASVWIYQADRPLTDAEVTAIGTQLQAFLQSWESHARPLKASYRILYNRFVVLAVDETLSGASGCSIDKSVHQIKDLEQHFGVGFFDRSQIAYLQGQTIQTVSLPQLKQVIADGHIAPETIIFNNLVRTWGDFEKSWAVKAQDSWMGKYFKQTA